MIHVSEDKVCWKNSCWFVGIVFALRSDDKKLEHHRFCMVFEFCEQRINRIKSKLNAEISTQLLSDYYGLKAKS